MDVPAEIKDELLLDGKIRATVEFERCFGGFAIQLTGGSLAWMRVELAHTLDATIGATLSKGLHYPAGSTYRDSYDPEACVSPTDLVMIEEVLKLNGVMVWSLANLHLLSNVQRYKVRVYTYAA